MSSWSPSSVFRDAVAEHVTVIRQLESQHGALELAASHMAEALLAGKKIIWCGNGGSAADAQHLAAELVGRFRHERCGLASIALTADTSILTSIANDYGYEQVFTRQVEALCTADDVVVGLSTSGNSSNVCLALQTARALGAFTVALTGETGGRLTEFADVCIHVASHDTARIQEAHILCGHMLCDWIEHTVCHAPELSLAGRAR